VDRTDRVLEEMVEEQHGKQRAEAAALEAALRQKRRALHDARQAAERAVDREKLDRERSEAKLYALTQAMGAEQRVAARAAEDAAQAAARDAERAGVEARASRRASFTALHEACFTKDGGNSEALAQRALAGDMDGVQDLLLQGFDLESRDYDGSTALSEAATHGNAELVSLLLRLGADPNTSNDQGRTPLYRAAFNSHLGVMRMLLEAGAYAAAARWVPFLTGAASKLLDEFDDVRRTEALQEARAAALQKGLHQLQDGWSDEAKQAAYEAGLRRELLQLAAAEGGSEALKEALLEYAEREMARPSRPSGPPNLSAASVVDEHGHNLLAVAAREGSAHAAHMLANEWKRQPAGLKRDVFRVDVDARLDGTWKHERGWTALSLAVSKGHAAVVEVLRAAGANPLIGTSINQTAFAIADNPARKKAMGAMLPALTEVLKPYAALEHRGGARPLQLKHMKREAPPQPRLLRPAGQGSCTRPPSPAQDQNACKPNEMAAGSYRKLPNESCFYRLKSSGQYGEQRLGQASGVLTGVCAPRVACV